jgi:hypothetical protein
LSNSGSDFFLSWQVQGFHIPILTGFCNFGKVMFISLLWLSSYQILFIMFIRKPRLFVISL